MTRRTANVVVVVLYVVLAVQVYLAYLRWNEPRGRGLPRKPGLCGTERGGATA